MTDRTLGVPNLASAKSQEVGIVQRDAEPAGRRSFFAPIFSWWPVSTALRTFARYAGGQQSAGPVQSGQSYNGITITAELSLTVAAVWGCVWRYANVVSTLPLHLMKGGPQNSATVARDHRLYTVLHDQPNRAMAATKFWQAMVGSMLTWGACYARKIYTDGQLVGLVPLRPERVTTVLGEDDLPFYLYASTGAAAGQPERLSAADVFVVLDRTLDGYTGLSRLQYAANSLGLAIAGDRAASLSFRNALRASGILTIGQWLKPEQRAAYKALLAEFTGTGSGSADDRQYGVLVAENATKFEALPLKTQDVELLASRRFSIEDVCRWYDVPPILVGHAGEGQTMWGTGVEQIMLGWLKMGLSPVLRAIEQEIWRQLLTVGEQQAGLYAEFNLEGLLRGDSAARASFYSQMAQNGIYTRNEIRARENLPPVEGGDVATVQSNLLPLDALGNLDPESAEGAKARNALRVFLGISDEKGSQ